MKLLAIDSSAKSASVAVTQDGRLISESFVNVGLTHSQTLLPLAADALRHAGLFVDEIDAFAVNNGPGSFTGIRIGVAAVKGLAQAKKKPCAAISTLESMAYLFLDTNAVICAAMDARCKQLYTALFRVHQGVVERLSNDTAQSVTETARQLAGQNEPVYITGDGAALLYTACRGLDHVQLAQESRRWQRAYGTALAAEYHQCFAEPRLLTPAYLRLPQAERELKLKQNKGDL